MPKKTPNAPVAVSDSTVSESSHPLAEVDGGPGRPSRDSDELIYRSVMRGGGEPFGPPYEIGVQTLTEKVVRFFKQRGFFGFEHYERSRPKRRRNRFTRYGASRFFGRYDPRVVHRTREEEPSEGPDRPGRKKK